MKTWIAVFALAAGLAQGAVRLPNIFGDNMVLQQGQAVPVWGWAEPGEQVTVEFAGQKKQATAKADGAWRVTLDALAASAEPRVFKVSGANTLELRNVVVGEVWFASGQSNMEWTVAGANNAQQEKENAKFPMIRHFKAPKVIKSEPQADINAKWEVTSPDTVMNQSAVAYFFGRRLHEALGVPVGLINCSWGGTRIEPWTPPCGFEGLPALEGIRNRVAMATPGNPAHQEALAKYVEAMGAWVADAQGRAAAKKALEAAPPEFPKNLLLPQAPGNNQEPTVLYNGMVSGLVPFAIKGAIWYQGCSNNGEGMLYLEKTKALVSGWRQVWGQGDFPYYLVQLAPFNYGANRATHLPGIWEAQAAVPAAIPNTGYAVINDIGNVKDIHPQNKQDVGLRLANQALNKTYGKADMIWSGPVYKSFAMEGAKMRVTFDHAQGLKTRDGKAPDWFELCGQDGMFKPAVAAIDGASVVLSHADIDAPLAMRFAWDQCAEPNLVNGAGLPAGAFRCGDTPKLDGVMASDVLKGFRKVYEIDLPANGNFGQSAPKYAVDNSAGAGDFAKVAYVLQLEDNGGGIAYVAATMDAFTKDAKRLGIPYQGSGIRHQTKVANLTVRANVEGVPALDNSDGGNIEFWATNYGPKNALGLPGANNGKYDFGDDPAGDGNYGCMQVHSWKDKVTLLAYNKFNGGDPCDIGIGNNTKGEHPDYTFMSNGNDYKTRRLTVLVK
ncbi:MAG: 9-O-acetylesterase [Kiritimatiellaeota bacterium]|nr:9-O-acetylesterase [Kiritimatiellota bacterium]